MPIKRARWHRRPVALTPLIDVIFLLLLFFMLSSTFTRFSEIPLVNAGGGAAGGAPPLFLQLGSDRVVLNGRAVALGDLPDAIGGLRDDAAAVLLVSMDADVTAQRLADVLIGLTAVPELAVSVLE